MEPCQGPTCPQVAKPVFLNFCTCLRAVSRRLLRRARSTSACRSRRGCRGSCMSIWWSITS